MTPQDFDALSKALIGKTIRAMYPGGDTTIGIGMDDGTFFCLTSRDYSLTLDQASWVTPVMQDEILVSEPSDGIL